MFRAGSRRFEIGGGGVACRMIWSSIRTATIGGCVRAVRETPRKPNAGLQLKRNARAGFGAVEHGGDAAPGQHRIPQLGRLVFDAENRGESYRLLTLVGDKVNLGLAGRAVRPQNLFGVGARKIRGIPSAANAGGSSE